MPDVKPFVAHTSSNSENMSRHEMLDWVNCTVHGQYKKIEELCSGVAYCQLMELLFPQCIGMKKVKMIARLEHEQLHNLKLLQGSFTRLNFDKSVPMERLVKGRFQDNFEFLQWFKKFFDTHALGKENLKVPAALAAAAANAPKAIRKPPPKAHPSADAGRAKHTIESSGYNDALKTPKNAQAAGDHSVSPSSVQVLKETKEHLADKIASVGHERNTYYKKLTEIEELLNQAVEDEIHVDWGQRILSILYDSGSGEVEFDSADI